MAATVIVIQAWSLNKQVFYRLDYHSVLESMFFVGFQRQNTKSIICNVIIQSHNSIREIIINQSSFPPTHPILKSSKQTTHTFPWILLDDCVYFSHVI